MAPSGISAAGTTDREAFVSCGETDWWRAWEATCVTQKVFPPALREQGQRMHACAGRQAKCSGQSMSQFPQRALTEEQKRQQPKKRRSLAPSQLSAIVPLGV